MSARRAVVESVIEVDSAVELACARRAMPAAEPLDDTLLSVLPSRGRAIDAPVGFEPEEPLAANRPLGSFRVAAPVLRLSVGQRLQRGMLTLAAAATAGAALIVPNVTSTVTASEAIVQRAPAVVSVPVSRDAARPVLDVSITEQQAREVEQAQLAEQARLAEEARVAEQARVAEEARLAEEARVAEEARLAEEARVAEEARAAEEARLAEEAAAAQQTAVAGSVTSGTSVSQAPSYASGSAQGAVSYALAQVGKPYSWGATGPSAYDCSGLMVASYSAVGIGLPRTSGAMMSAGYAVSYADLQPGDLIISYGGGHVGMYIGGGQMVHASDYGIGVIVSSISGYQIDAMRRVA